LTAKRAARRGVLTDGSFGAFVLDQLSELGGIEAKPMFGGAGFYLDGTFFGILYQQRLYFRVSPATVGEYKKRQMKPFRPFAGRKGTSKNYYEVPTEILESPDDLVKWAKAAQQAPRSTQNKTTPTRASVDDYIASRATERQYDDCRQLMALLKKVTRKRPRMWGPSIVGFGSYRYKYDSGRTGEAPLAAFAIRGRELVVYKMPEARGQRALLAKLGKHRDCHSCLYFKRLADLDKSVLEKVVAGSIAEVKRLYG
jgi:TfoX/Sxy family transcriptional regulator of competence genes